MSNNVVPVYEEINEATYQNVLNSVTNSAPALPDRNRDAYENHGFFVLNKGKGILVSNTCSDDTSNLIPTSSAAIS